jgi:hypothetical protein
MSYSIGYAERPAKHCSAGELRGESITKMLKERGEWCQNRDR